jgi:probable HAF family extracellular repeat protein
MTDLGVLSGEDDSYANAINAAGQIVGGTYTSQGGPYTAFLWENGGPMVDLNALVTPPSALHNLHLEYGYAIADDGKILAFGRLPSGDVRIALLAPHGDGVAIAGFPPIRCLCE